MESHESEENLDDNVADSQGSRESVLKNDQSGDDESEKAGPSKIVDHDALLQQDNMDDSEEEDGVLPESPKDIGTKFSLKELGMEDSEDEDGALPDSPQEGENEEPINDSLPEFGICNAEEDEELFSQKPAVVNDPLKELGMEDSEDDDFPESSKEKGTNDTLKKWGIENSEDELEGPSHEPSSLQEGEKIDSLKDLEAENSEEDHSTASQKEKGAGSSFQNTALEDSDEEDGGAPDSPKGDADSFPQSHRNDNMVYDFDIMMQKKRDGIRRRKRKNIDLINDSDDVIAELIQDMKQAAEEDFLLNKNRKAATRKLKQLPIVETQLRKIDLREAFLDAGALGVVTDWLTPLPDRSLPNLQVRDAMLKILLEFNVMDVERLKASGIGRAVMYLYKHPKETKDNRKRAGSLISSWSRPIFNLETDFHSISKEERENRDHEHMAQTKKRCTSKDDEPSPSKTKAEEKATRPNQKGFVTRARVPMPSTRDYVIRPRSSIDSELTRSGSKKSVSRLDKHLRSFMEKKKQMKTQRAVKMSLEGRKMSL